MEKGQIMTVIKSETTKEINDNGVEVVVEVEERSIENYRNFEILFFESGLHKNYFLDFEYKVINSLEPISESADGEGVFHVYDTIVENINITGERTLVNGYEVFEGIVTRVTVLNGGLNGYFYKTNIAAIQHLSQEDLGEVFNKVWGVERNRRFHVEDLSDSYKSYKKADKRLVKSLAMFLLLAVIAIVATLTHGVTTLDTVEILMFCLIFVLGGLPVTINVIEGIKAKKKLKDSHRLVMERMDKRVLQEMWKRLSNNHY